MKVNMTLLQRFMQNHAHPQGKMGKLVAWRLAKVNRQANAWAVDLLAIQPDDHVLEIGFGPGTAVAQLAALAYQGRVCGVDSSAVMLQTASRRNAATIAAGRVELRLAGIERLPYPDASFAKALAVQVLNYLPDPLSGLREVRRVLKPGGWVALFYEAPEKFARTRKILAAIYQPYSLDEGLALLQQAGFQRTWYQVKTWWYGKGYCVLGEVLENQPSTNKGLEYTNSWSA